MIKPITIVVALALGAARIWIGGNFEPEPFSWLDAYKDAAHIFIGGVGVAWWIQRYHWQWWTFWTLNAVEIAVAILSRG